MRRALITLAWGVTLVALLYGEENWRGRRAWNHYRQELESLGAQLDLKAFVPPLVSESQNFAATPLVQAWFPKRNSWNDNYSKADASVPTHVQGPRQFLDLVAWERAFNTVATGKQSDGRPYPSGKLDAVSRAKAAPAVLSGLKDDEPIFVELRLASQRPISRYPVVYDMENPWGILLPHLAKIKATTLRLQLKSCAELSAGRGETALEDVKLALFMADSVKDEPFLMSFLVRAECLRIAVHPIWEGLAEHRWSEVQLRDLQATLQRYDFLNDFKRPREAERAAVILTAELLYRQKYRLKDLFDSSPDQSQSTVLSELANLLGRIAPHGWYQLERVNVCRLYQSASMGAFDAAQRRISPHLLAADAHEFERKLEGGRLGKELNAILHHQILTTMLLPGFFRVPIKAASAQIAIDQAALACALERYRLANGQVPGNLESLVPRFLVQLPRDVLTGEPFRYRKTGNDTFVLYSIGWNERDDGGVPGGSLYDEKEGDWVW